MTTEENKEKYNITIEGFDIDYLTTQEESDPCSAHQFATMINIKKLFLPLLTAVLVIAGLGGCKTNDIENQAAQVNKESTATTENVEIKTIEPPEDGWTLEDLLSVTYIYGNQLTVPCTVGSLDSNFSLDTSNNLEFEDKTCSVFLNYKDMPISTINLDENKVTKINSNTKINKLVFSLSINNDNKNNIIINGIDFNCNKEQAVLKLGDSYEILNEYSIAYYYSTKNESNQNTVNRVLWLMFDESDNLVTIGILIND